MRPWTSIPPAVVLALGALAAPATGQDNMASHAQGAQQQPDIPPGDEQSKPDPNAGVVPPPLPPAVSTMVAAPPGTEPGAGVVEVGGNMTPPPPPLDHYPLCGGAIQDHCMQRRDAPAGYGK